MPDNQGNRYTSMEQVIRSPSSVGIFNIHSESHAFTRKSFDSYMSALGPGLLDAPFNYNELQRSGPLEIYNRRNVRSYITDTKDQDMDKVQIMSRYNRQIEASKVHKLEGNHFRGSKPHLPPKSGNHSNPSRKQQGMGMISPQEQDMHARAVAAASAAAAQAAAAAAHAAAEVMRLTYVRKAEMAATIIQAAYRGHLARQALRALKGLVKLQAVIRGHLVRRQARIALRCMQALVRLQARARARQVKALLDDQERSGNLNKVQLVKAQEAFQQQQLKLQEMTNQHRRIMQDARSPVQRLHRTSASKVQHADSASCTGSFSSHDESQDWDGSPLSKEEIEYRVRKRQEAMALRQKALAYAEHSQARRARQPKGTERAADDHDYADERQLVKAAQLTPERHGEGAVSGRSGRLLEAEFQDSVQMMRDWSWLEGWMGAQYGVSSTLWESQDAGDFDDNDTDCLYDDQNHDKYLYDDNEEAEEEYDAMDEILGLQHRLARFNGTRTDDHGVVVDDHPFVKIIEMDRVATPPSYRHHHHSPSHQSVNHSE